MSDLRERMCSNYSKRTGYLPKKKEKNGIKHIVYNISVCNIYITNIQNIDSHLSHANATMVSVENH